jgi:hypothetical protein
MLKTLYDIVTTDSHHIDTNDQKVAQEVGDALYNSLRKVKTILENKGQKPFDITILQVFATQTYVKDPRATMILMLMGGAIADLFTAAFAMGIAAAIEGKLE